MLEIIKKTLTDNAILGAIFSSVAIILLGFYLRKKEILNSNASKMLTKVVLTISLPALAFTYEGYKWRTIKARYEHLSLGICNLYCINTNN